MAIKQERGRLPGVKQPRIYLSFVGKSKHMVQIELAAVVVAFIGLVTAWGKLIFYKYITDHDADVKKRVESNIDTLLEDYKNATSKNKRHEIMIKDIPANLKAIDVMENAKIMFEKNVFTSLGIFVLAFIAYSFIVDSNPSLASSMSVVVLMVGLVVMDHVQYLFAAKNKLEQFLSDKPAQEVFRRSGKLITFWSSPT
ncbi:MAG: hypothetical protein HY515_04810 [Candidatus Aenigmarchaeota archaeon]|nr:hypothetical protein [Candidatus Aenigmarchaeota archaeon]